MPSAAETSAARGKAETCKNNGNAHLAAGKLQAAADCYRQAIALDPRYAEAFNNLGFVLHQLGSPDEAMQALHQAIRLNPHLANAHFNLGTLRQAQGDLDSAIASFREALAIRPDITEAAHSLFGILYERGRLNEAGACLRQIIATRPDDVKAHINLGAILQKQGRHDEALDCLQQALAFQSDSFEAHYNRGVILNEQGRHDEAITSFRQAVVVHPDSAEAHWNLGSVLLIQRHFSHAREAFEAAASLKPDLDGVHYNTALAAGLESMHLGILDEAVIHLQQAIAIEPLQNACNNLGLVLSMQGRFDEAIACFREISSTDQAGKAAQFNIGLALLSSGRVAEGWEHYNRRFAAETQKREFPHLHWCGEPLGGKALLIWGEQGVGDEILHANMFQEMIERTRCCVIECTPKLVPLFARSFPDAQVVPSSDPPHPATLADIDLQCAAGSLARWLRPSVASFPSHNGYLRPDPARVDFWRARLAALGPGPKVGFAWRSSQLYGVRHLYCTTLDQWGPIFAVPGVQFINLQYDQCTDELADARQRFGVALHAFEEVDLFNDLAEAAALTRALDLVVSAPTASSFLAGAVGVPTWMMTYGIPWQTLGTDHFPWFPVMRVFPRRWDQTWDTIIDTVAGQLRAHSAASFSDA